MELFEEQQRLIKVDPGEKVTLAGMELWSAPALTEADCLSGFLELTWIVRDRIRKAAKTFRFISSFPEAAGLQRRSPAGQAVL